MLLEIRDISVYYAKSMAVHEVSLEVAEGEIVSIMGANGAGKSTVLKALAGLVPLRGGEIVFDGRVISGRETPDIVKRGIVLTPEGRQLFPYMSVRDNLRLGATLRRDRKAVAGTLDYVYDLFPRLKERQEQQAGTLSGGEQQMLAIGRSLMAAPRLLCMDEPSLGLAPVVVERVGEVVREINGRGVTVLLVEQNVHLAMQVASRGYVMQVGQVVLGGDIGSLQSSDIMKKAYLGG